MRKWISIPAFWMMMLPGLEPSAEAQPAPPQPPPPLVELPAPLPWPIPEAAVPPAQPAPKPGDPPKITLQKSEELGPQGESGASEVRERKSSVKVSGTTLTAVLTGTAAAYPAVACPGTALSTMRLVQPLTIEPASGASPLVNITLSAKAEGYVRSLEPSRAGLRTASAMLQPAGGGPPLTLALPPAMTGDGGRLHYQESLSIPTTPMPGGCYVLVVDFTVEAAVPSRFHGFAEAVFSKSTGSSDRITSHHPVFQVSQEGHGLFHHRTRTPVTDPFRQIDTKLLGFTVTLKAEGITADPSK